MRCVILGGAGFLGRHIGRAMAAAGSDVWAVDLSVAALADEVLAVLG